MYTRTKTFTDTVLDEVRNERLRQLRKHGVQTDLPDGTGPDMACPVTDGSATRAQLAESMKRRCRAVSRDEGGDGSITFEHILTEEWAEAITEEDPERLYDELIQVAAVAVQWAEKLTLEARGRG